jgi:glutamyl-tRNA synthetase
MIDMGVGETDISISLDTLYAENRKLVEPKANRYFFVWDPVELEITGTDPCTANPPLHPTENRGCREIDVSTKVLVCREDVEKLTGGSKVRLKDLYNVEITSMEPLQANYLNDAIESAKKDKMKIIHWAPVDGVPVKVLSPDGEFKGIGEKQITAELDKVVQFERFGFCRIDSVTEEVVAYYTHK